jgi:hypothetical protein
MKGRGGERASKTDVDIGEPKGAFVGFESGEHIGGTPPSKTRARTRVTSDTFHASGESQATSISAARKPSHWRRGGFVSHGGSHKTGQAPQQMRHGSDVKHGPPPDADRDEETNYKRGGGKWMAGAVKHPGALHRSLGVPQGQKIPAAKIAKAAHSSNPTLRRRAVLAQTFAKHRP